MVFSMRMARLTQRQTLAPLLLIDNLHISLRLWLLLLPFQLLVSLLIITLYIRERDQCARNSFALFFETQFSTKVQASQIILA